MAGHLRSKLRVSALRMDRARRSPANTLKLDLLSGTVRRLAPPRGGHLRVQQGFPRPRAPPPDTRQSESGRLRTRACLCVLAGPARILVAQYARCRQLQGMAGP